MHVASGVVMKIPFGSLLSCAALLSGCSATLDTTTPAPGAAPAAAGTPGSNGNPADPKTPPSVDPQALRYNAPEGTWTRATNVEHYRVWASHEEAATWFAGYDADAAARYNRTARTALPHSDARYAAIEAKIAAVWAGFKLAFPRDTEGLSDPPRVLLVQTNVANAYVSYDKKLACSTGAPLGCHPHSVVILTPLLTAIDAATTSGSSEDLLAGLMEHELAHHVLKHAADAAKAKITKYYEANTSLPLGFQNKVDNASVRKIANDWISEAEKVGSSSHVELHGWPLNSTSRFQQLAFGLLRAGFDVNAKGCTAVNPALTAFSPVYTKVYDNIRQVIVIPNDAERASLDKSVTEILNQSATCTSTLKSFDAALKNVLLEDGTAVIDTLTAEENTIVDDAATPFAAVAALTENSRKRMRALEPSIGNIRFYTEEEEADDVAVYVAQKAKLSLRAYGAFMNNAQQGAADRDTCTTIRATGAEPPYGALSDTHHATCWRVDHAERMAKLLEAQK
jgi:hypothetical protein